MSKVKVVFKKPFKVGLYINRYVYWSLERTPELNPPKKSKNLRKHKNCIPMFHNSQFTIAKI